MRLPSGPKNSNDSRSVSSLVPCMNSAASTPSIGRSVGTLSEAPAKAAKVWYQSCAESICWVTTPSGTVPG